MAVYFRLDEDMPVHRSPIRFDSTTSKDNSTSDFDGYMRPISARAGIKSWSDLAQ